MQISATVNHDTVKAIRQMAEDQKRSFSEMVDIILTQAASQPRKVIITKNSGKKYSSK